MVRFAFDEMQVVSKYMHLIRTLISYPCWKFTYHRPYLWSTCASLHVQEFLGVSPEKVHVVHSGVSCFLHVYSFSIFWRILHVLSASSSLISVT